MPDASQSHSDWSAYMLCVVFLLLFTVVAGRSLFLINDERLLNEHQLQGLRGIQLISEQRRLIALARGLCWSEVQILAPQPAVAEAGSPKDCQSALNLVRQHVSDTGETLNPLLQKLELEDQFREIADHWSQQIDPDGAHRRVADFTNDIHLLLMLGEQIYTRSSLKLAQQVDAFDSKSLFVRYLPRAIEQLSLLRGSLTSALNHHEPLVTADSLGTVAVLNEYIDQIRYINDEIDSLETAETSLRDSVAITSDTIRDFDAYQEMILRPLLASNEYGGTADDFFSHTTMLVDQFYAVQRGYSSWIEKRLQHQIESGRTTLLLAGALFLAIYAVLIIVIVRYLRAQSLVKKTLASLAESVTTLERSRESQRRMFGIISHELRTPAASLSMMVNDFVLSQADRKEMSASITHLLNVIDDLRVAVNPEDQIEIHQTLTQIPELIREVERHVAPLYAGGALSLSIKADNLDQSLYVTDAYRLRAVLTNLLRNAYLHSNGTHVWLDVTAEQLDAERTLFRFCVEDDGQGIPEKDVERVFQPFERGETRSGGLGAGLHIVRHWIERLGGTVRYTPGTRGGARFDIELALLSHDSSSDTDVQTIPHDLSAAHIMQGLTVLLVEDDRILRKLTGRQLQKLFSMRLLTAENGQQALDILADNDVDLVLTDYFMPEVNGCELILAVRERYGALPIVAITAATIGQERDELLAAGADAVLSKPFEIDAFAQVVNRLRRQGLLGHGRSDSDHDCRDHVI